MFGMGMPEVLLILAIALIVIGPKKLPDLAKSLGRAMVEFKKATSELKASLEDDADVTDVKKTFRDMDQSIRKPVKTPVDIGGPAPSRSKALIPKEETLPTVEPPAPGMVEKSAPAEPAAATIPLDDVETNRMDEKDPGEPRKEKRVGEGAVNNDA